MWINKKLPSNFSAKIYRMPALVSVICLCYNHEKFIEEALRSVLFQRYWPFEIIIVDDASQDKSWERIQKFIQEIEGYQEAYQMGAAFTLAKDLRIECIQHTENKGNCASFNEAWKIAQGKYIIDFATDDVMLDTRLAQQVAHFESLPPEYGVIFSNALAIDEAGKALHYHFPMDAQGKSIPQVPQGDIYEAILKKYFIPTATMMIKNSVLQDLQGYDESLSYEDFDFWIRSARKYKYAYQDEVTTLRRLVKNSHAAQFYKRGNNPHLISTLKVCEKAWQLNQNEAENRALAQNIHYHQRQALYTDNFDLVGKFEVLRKKVEGSKRSFKVRMVLLLARLRISVYPWYKMYLYLRKQSNKIWTSLPLFD